MCTPEEFQIDLMATPAEFQGSSAGVVHILNGTAQLY